MIEFASVSKKYRDGTAAVVDLSLVVPSDKITVIVGPSGCGKTTTLRMVNRMLEPSGGQITWDGKPLKSKRKTTLRRQMGYVIQNGGLFPHRTVVENIGTVPGLLGWDRSKTRSRSLELLDNVGLDRKLADRYPAQLSGGQQQRVGVARALAADPLVLLMDEPFSAVDPVVRSELHDFFLNLQTELSKTIILITHDIDEAIKLGDQVAILRVGGRLAQVGTPRELLEEPADAFVEGFVGRDRGFRALGFQPASTLTLESVPVVRSAEAAGQDEPTLVLDADAQPQGWADPNRPGQLLRLGGTFDPASDSLRVALDSALTSPYGRAVAVDRGTGRYAGVATVEAILNEVGNLRSGQAGTEPVRPSDAEPPAAEPEAEAEPLVAEPAAEAEPATAGGSSAIGPTVGVAGVAVAVSSEDDAIAVVDERERGNESNEDKVFEDRDAEGVPEAVRTESPVREETPPEDIVPEDVHLDDLALEETERPATSGAHALDADQFEPRAREAS